MTALALRDQREHDRQFEQKLLAPQAGRIPPHDLDAEAAIISASLLDIEAYVEASNLVEHYHFYSEANRRIFEAIGELYRKGGVVDIVTVAGELREKDRLAQVGGTTYLAQLIDSVPAVAHIAHYAKTVREHARTRSVIACGQKIAAEGYGGPTGEEAEAFLDRIQTELGKACDVEERSPIVTAYQLSEQFIQSLSATDVDTLGVKMGYADIDDILSLRMGEVTFLAARPGMGKTALMMGAIINMTWPQERDPEDPELPTAGGVFSLEMPKEQLWGRASCAHGFVDMGKLLRRKLDGEDMSRLVGACNDLAGLPIWLDDTPAISIGTFRTKLRLMKHYAARQGKKLRIVAIDYVQLMSGTSGMPREQQIAEISRNLKRAAKEEKLHILALAQLNRDVEERSPPIPQLSDLRESGALEQDADNVLFIYRQEYYEIMRQKPVSPDAQGVALVIIAKQRNGSTGSKPPRLKFWASMTRFDNLAEWP